MPLLETKQKIWTRRSGRGGEVRDGEEKIEWALVIEET